MTINTKIVIDSTMAKSKGQSLNMLFIAYLVAIILLIIFCSMNKKKKTDGYLRVGSPPLAYSCEFQPACLWDTARWVQLSNGMQGVCTLHGIACPSFSTDHDRNRFKSKSPTMVSSEHSTTKGQNMDDIYGGVNKGDKGDKDLSGITALGLGMYS